MSEKKKSKLLQGCLVGCAILTFLGVVAIGSFSVLMWDMTKGFDEAMETRAELEERFGAQEEFEPLSDGSIPAANMERFLAVRNDLEPLCTRFEETFGAFERMDQGENEGRDPTARDIFGLVKSAMGMTPLLGDLFAARNEALLKAELGLGEYTYIYVVSYYSWLDLEASALADDNRGDRTSNRIHAAMITMLRAQRSRLSDETEMIAVLDGEIATLQEEPERVPWADGVPAALEASLEPFHDRLEASFCPATAEVDLNRNRSRGPVVYVD